MRTVTMSPNGRLTLPVEVRQKLGLTGGEAEFDVEVTDHGSVTLRPVVVLPRDDTWAYTAEHLARVAKALDDVREGRVRHASEADLAAYDN
jgi:AbrB family looped-hinge helix DNA binding protein